VSAAAAERSTHAARMHPDQAGGGWIQPVRVGGG
jgi:hypothetical protein